MIIAGKTLQEIAEQLPYGSSGKYIRENHDPLWGSGEEMGPEDRLYKVDMELAVIEEHTICVIAANPVEAEEKAKDQVWDEIVFHEIQSCYAIEVKPECQKD